MRGRSRLIIALAAVLVLLLLFYLFLIRPRKAELAEVREQVAAEEARGQQLQLELSRLRGLQEQAPALEARLARFEQLVPGNHQVPNFLFLVQRAANQAGVGFLSITNDLPDLPPEGAPIAEVRTQIQARGGYFSIQDFMRRLYDLQRALRIDIVQMAGVQDATDDDIKINLDITARIFFQAPGLGVDTTTTTPDVQATPAG